MNKELLLEIGCEEIPHWMIPDAVEQLAAKVKDLLAGVGVPWESVSTAATPRRLTVGVHGLPERQGDREETVTGPPASTARDASGTWTRAAAGFAAKHGVGVADLRVVATSRGEYVAVDKKTPGRPVTDILSERLPALIRSMTFPKTMTWIEGADGFPFVRPIRNLLAVFDGVVVPFRLAGLDSGDTTFGHRFLGERRVVARSFAEYERSLSDNGVVVSPRARREMIASAIQRAEKDIGLRVVPDDGLMDQVTELNEAPGVVAGAFDPAFLSLPSEVLVTVLRKHQKYFSFVNPSGTTAPRFLAVINMPSDPDCEIRRGHERVLKARLTDASFFWDVDGKKPLSDRVDGLSNVLFQETLGSYLEKTRRLEALAPAVAVAAGFSGGAAREAGSAARLCKADLTTEMVKELTELQGVMGGLYAREEKLAEGVWRAVYEHYRPEGPDDPVPTCPPGTALSLADKLDTIAGMVGLGFVPSGSRDPFGLRRLAAGVYRILIEGGLDVPLRGLFERARDLLTSKLPAGPFPWEALEEFLEARLKTLFQAAGFRYDEIQSVIRAGVYRPVDARRRLAALAAVRSDARFGSIFTARKRVWNILAKQGGAVDWEVDASLFEEAEERCLHDLTASQGAPIREAAAGGRYGDALDLIGGFAAPVDAYFDKVLVMHGDHRVRLNRLQLLKNASDLFDEVCDFSKLVESGGRMGDFK